MDSEEPALSLGAEVTVCYRTLRLLVLASQADRRILDLFALASLVDDPSESEMRTYAFLLLPIDRGVDMDGVDASVEFMSFFRAFHVLNEDPKEQVPADSVIRWRAATQAIAYVMALCWESEGFMQSYVTAMDPAGTFASPMTEELAAGYLRILACAEPAAERYLMRSLEAH